MKNRFCRNTKLSEKEFEHLVFLCVSGYTASDAHKMLRDWGMKVSRQTVSTTFLELGDYIYLNLFREKAIALYRDASPHLKWPDSAWEEFMFNHIWKHLHGTLDYAEFRKQNAPYPFDDVSLVQYLRNRWRQLNGFPHKTLVSHVGVALIACVPAPQTHEGWEMRTNWLLDELAKNPL